ncbi:methyl-accepting chemotaxis protein [Legionella impletisoli]|uniref:Methyl-accepting chemotaxis protein n=1 Tax=Legionella impletisoli TaxID=343510 RepID=A0A917N8Y1_9GAMM|nr:methyl-accepting chemotaxis protein [Legionella impletisoli]GGI78144.1 methyl-accepting chemotaxis protein [Legionella impletisoli]
MKLYAKLMLSFGLLFLISLAVVSFVATKSATEALQDSIGNDLKHICQSAANSIDRYLQSKITDAKIISETLLTQKEDPQGLNQYFTNLKEETNDYQDIFFVNKDGIIVASTAPNLINKKVAEESPILDTLFNNVKELKPDEVIFQDGYYNEQTNALEIHILIPVYDEKPSLTGVLVIALNMDAIKNFVVQLEKKTPGDKAAFLVDKKGRLLASGNPDAVLWQTLPDAEINPKLKTIAASDEDGFTIYTDKSGDRVLAGYADLEEFGVNKGGSWEVFSVAPVNVIFAPVDKLQNTLLWTSVIIIVLVLILSYLLARYITKPLNQMSKRINEIANASGDLTQRIEITTQDEIGKLAEAFNRMISGIREIVQRVLETSDGVSSSSQQLSSSSEELSAATEEIAAAVQQISRASQNQAQQVQETSQVIEQLNKNLDEVKKASQQSASTSDQATEVAQQGGVSMLNTLSKMNSIHDKVTDTANVIKTLYQRSEQIGEIVETITNIADQTNLLALNAAIEAARAGEAGRGFAVVAEEVRKLAEGSAKAADQISELIIGIQKETANAVKAMKLGSEEVEEGREIAAKTSEALENIISTVEKTSDSIQLISESTEHLATGHNQVVLRIEEIASAAEESAASSEEVGSSTQQMSASMQEIASSSQELAQMALMLQEMVKRFKVEESTHKD